MKKKIAKYCMIALALGASHLACAQKVALKSNLLYDATTSINAGIEIGLSPKLSIDLSGNVNPWGFSNNRKLKHWMVQPELRFWSCQRFSGSFWGIHAHYARYNVSRLPGMFSENMRKNRYEGWLAGAGVGYGYHWILGNHWSLEAEIGVGYAHLEYRKYPCATCGAKLKSDKKEYIGPTKAAISLIYIIK